MTRTNSGNDRPSRGDSSLRGDSARFAPGTMLGRRFRIIGRLGRGGMGEVYEAEDLTLGMPVALKFLPDALGGDPQWKQRLMQEVRVARQVSHANVCRVFDIDDADGLHFVTMEYIDGENLASLLRRIGRLPHDKALDLARQLCAGLAAVHEQGLLHRDLKPTNVMVDGRGKLRLADFGLAGLKESFGAGEVRSGTPAYMAPEQLSGRGVSVRSDIYALGLVLYEMFTGKRTFEGATLAELERQHLEATPTAPTSLIQELDPAVSRVILRCLEKEPERRPASALQVSAALPGGDPLAAALAAGETPSPELVAAAGRHEGIAPRLALGCLAGVLCGLLGFVFAAAPRNLLNHAPGLQAPAVMAARATEMLGNFGIDLAGHEVAYGLTRDAARIDHIRKTDPRPERWQALATGRPAAVSFWLRAGPGELVPAREPLQVLPGNPPNQEPGMLSLRLSPAGRLEYLHRVPLRQAEPGLRAVTVAELFTAAGLDLGQFVAVAPEADPPNYCDEWTVWRGPGAEDGETLRVAAALLRGVPVWFAIERAAGVAASQPAAETASRPASQPGAERTAAERTAGLATELSDMFAVGLMLAMLGLAGFMAWRNVSLGRGDRRGAFRLALVVFLSQMLTWLMVGAHGRLPATWIAMAFRMAAYALLFAGCVWVGYVAIEPYVRRRWPSVMIGWTRLLGGAWRDPLVGRDVLYGCVLGVAIAWCWLMPWGFAALASAPPPPPTLGEPGAQFTAALGPHAWLGMLAANLLSPALSAISMLLILFVLRALLGRQWLAVTAMALLFVGLFGLQAVSAGGFGDAAALGQFVGNVTAFGASAFFLLRFGALAAIVGTLVANLLLTYPITADAHAWYFGATAFAVGVIALLALLTFQTARAGRAVLAADWLER